MIVPDDLIKLFNLQQNATRAQFNLIFHDQRLADLYWSRFTSKHNHNLLLLAGMMSYADRLLLTNYTNNQI